MREKALNLLGLMRKANAIDIGETNTGASVKAGKAKLLLLAEDASDNARKRAETFVYGRNVPVIKAPFTKAEISAHVGLGGCSMAAINDLGFANALMKSLAAMQPEVYGTAAEETQQRLTKAAGRKTGKAAQETNKRIGKRRTNI